MYITQLIKKVCLLGLGLYGVSVSASTLYCAPNGNDATGNGSISMPYRTLQYAIDLAVSGDIVELRQGNYVSNEIRINISNLTIRSYPGEKASITCPTNDENLSACIWYHEPDIVGGLLENLEIIGGYYYGIKLESNWDWGVPANQRQGTSNITIRNCNIHHTGRDCIKLTPGCQNINISSCEIHHSGVGIGNDPNDPNAEGIDNVNSNMWVHNCYFHDISTNGVYAKGGAKNCIIEENLVMNTGEGGILVGFYTDSDWFDEVNNPDYYEAIDCIVRNNIVVNTGGAGLGFWGAKNCAAYNNTIVTASPKFHSPLFFNTGEIWISAVNVKYPKNLNVKVQNNVFVDQSGTTDDDLTVEIRPDALSGTSVINHNLYYKTTGAASFTDGVAWPNFTFAQWQSQMGFDANGMESNPQLNAQYHLNSNSPCIDAGTTIPSNTRDYDGGSRSGALDLGADERNSGVALNTPPAAGVTGTGAVALTSDIRDNRTVVEFTLYPNPTTDKVYISTPLPLAIETVHVYNVSGQIIACDLEQMGKNLVITTSGLSEGSYLLTVGNSSKWFQVKK